MSTTKKVNKFNIQQKIRALKSNENEHWIEYINENSKQRENDEQMMSTQKLIKKNNDMEW